AGLLIPIADRTRSDQCLADELVAQQRRQRLEHAIPLAPTTPANSPYSRESFLQHGRSIVLRKLARQVRQDLGASQRVLDRPRELQRLENRGALRRWRDVVGECDECPN